MPTPIEILHKYWGYEAFRPGQLELANAALQGKDCIGLLPTGAGKSLCFQIPGLCKNGITLVVSPLIALMKDQVSQLKKRNISAIALHSGLSFKQIDFTLQNALNGAYKFIYVSPERLKTKRFREYIPNLNIQLLVVDEAHCISQWGYDFRPPYLQIFEVRELLEDIPVMAVTASAPDKIVHDIGDKLLLKNPFIFKGNFARNNLHFHNIETENKSGYLINALKKIKGSIIIFCGTRGEVESTTQFLKSKNFRCDYYHAGLDFETRSKKQELWMNNQYPIMVCTNAFGMGVDKPDVRFVFHMDPPANADAYYQEAGRAGRDGNESWCILLHNDIDFNNHRVQIENEFPDSMELEKCYNAIMNYYEIAAGSGDNRVFEFYYTQIAERYKLPIKKFYNAAKNLEALDFFSLSDGFFSPSKIKFIADYSSVYEYKIRFNLYQDLIDVLLRSYVNIMDNYITIQESFIASKLQIDEKHCIKLLNELFNAEIIDYIAASSAPKITFLEARTPYPQFDLQMLYAIKEKKMQQLQIMQNYIHEKNCRASFWIQYYTNENAEYCGKCDLCNARRKKALTVDKDKWVQFFQDSLGNKSVLKQDLIDTIPVNSKAEAIEVLRWLLDNKQIISDANLRLYWKK